MSILSQTLALFHSPPPCPDKPGGLAINDKLFRFNCPSGNISEVVQKNIKQVGRAERDLESEAPETDLNILVNGENGHRINPTVTRFLRQQKVEQLTHSGGFIDYIFATTQRFFSCF